MVKSSVRSGGGSPATTAKSYFGSPSSERSTPNTSQTVPNSNGRKPLTTTTAMLRSMATSRPGVAAGRWQDISQLWLYCHWPGRRVPAMLVTWTFRRLPESLGGSAPP